jgi:starch synthase
LTKLAIDLCDGIIIGSEKINPDITKYLKKTDTPILEYVEGDDYVDAYSTFYDTVLEEVEELV